MDLGVLDGLFRCRLPLRIGGACGGCLDSQVLGWGISNGSRSGWGNGLLILLRRRSIVPAFHFEGHRPAKRLRRTWKVPLIPLRLPKRGAAKAGFRIFRHSYLSWPAHPWEGRHSRSSNGGVQELGRPIPEPGSGAEGTGAEWSPHVEERAGAAPRERRRGGKGGIQAWASEDQGFLCNSLLLVFAAHAGNDALERPHQVGGVWNRPKCKKPPRLGDGFCWIIGMGCLLRLPRLLRSQRP